MRLALFLIVLMPSCLLGQEYHIKDCDNRFYRLKTQRVKFKTLDTVYKYKLCVERRYHPNGKYYFYHDSVSKYPYFYQLYKNNKTTYKKNVGDSKVRVPLESAYLTFYDNGIIKSEEGWDTAAFDFRKNTKKYYDSFGNLYWKWQLNLKGIDEFGNTVEKFEKIILDNGDTLSHTLGYGPKEPESNGYYYKTTEIYEYDSITNIRIGKKLITQIKRTTDFWGYYLFNDTIYFKYNLNGRTLAKIQSIFINSDILNKKVSYLNDSIIEYDIKVKQGFSNSDSSCNLVQLNSNGIPSYLKLNYCGQDSLILKYDSTGEETYRELFIVPKPNCHSRFTYLFKPNREQYLVKKEICKRRRCKIWLYNAEGELLEVSKYKN